MSPHLVLCVCVIVSAHFEACKGNVPAIRMPRHHEDQSDTGCYCSDEELRGLLRKLPPLPPASAVPRGSLVKLHVLANGFV